MNKADLQFNKGTATWKGKMLMEMSRQELYDAFDELGKLYTASLMQNHE